jgi:hypothetical protein
MNLLAAVCVDKSEVPCGSEVAADTILQIMSIREKWW